MSDRAGQPRITPEMLLRAYAIGIFPMAEARDDPNLYWIDPEKRGILPLDRFHVPRSLRKTLRRRSFEVTFDRDFEAVLEGCAAPAPGRRQTWINDLIFDLCRKLHVMGFAHSVEVRSEGELVGGLYGIALGGVFSGESMFSRRTDASKVALVHLVRHLADQGFTLLDTQFLTPHLMQFGAIEVEREEYRRRLRQAIKLPVKF
jgi:leucyl/phenylalanyl-tRNA--protein transferase